MSTDGQQLYEVTVQATGEVRDADGNVISTPTFAGTRIVTEQEAAALRRDLEGSGS